MVKETIAYTDFDGNSRKEDFWFHLSRAELIAWDIEAEGGIQATIARMINEQDTRRLATMIKDIILRAYGEKSIDGRRFKKSEELRESFEQSEAFSTLYLDLLGDAEKCAKFINNILPNEITSSPEYKAQYENEMAKLANG